MNNTMQNLLNMLIDEKEYTGKYSLTDHAALYVSNTITS